jgi:predicted metal-binding protein
LIVEKELFSDMCRKGCINYNKKYCCPPFSPKLNDYVKNYEYLIIILLKIDLDQFSKYKEYHKLRVGNAIIKPRIEKLMRILEKDFNTKFLSSGACRLCKPCQKKLNKPCKHPNKMRFSLESLGVDCNKLVEKLFNFKLLWYKDKKAPQYTAVVCGLPLKETINKNKYSNIINKRIDELCLVAKQ